MVSQRFWQSLLDDACSVLTVETPKFEEFFLSSNFISDLIIKVLTDERSKTLVSKVFSTNYSAEEDLFSMTFTESFLTVSL